MVGRSSESFAFGPFSFSEADGLRRDGRDVPLPPRAIAVLAALLDRPDRLVSKAELLDAGWKDAFVTEASLLEAVHVLRTALGDDRRAPTYIQTVHRRGYRFVAPLVRATTERRALPEGTPAGALDAGGALPPFISEPEWRMILRRCSWVVAATVATSVLVAAFGPRPPEPPAARAVVALPAGLRLPAWGGSVSASPDGRRVAYVALHDGHPALFLRDILHPATIELAGARDPADPFFSPDGRVLGFFAGGQLTVAEPGGAPHAIAPAVAGAGATWVDRHTILFGGGPGGGLARVSVTGGPPEVVLQPEVSTPDVRFGWPDVLPGGGLLFTVLTPAGRDVAILDPGASRHRILVRDAAFGRYASTGHLVVERAGQLVAAPFDLARRAITGPLRRVVQGVASGSDLEGPRYAFSESGALVYVGGDADGAPSVAWRTSEGPSPGRGGVAFDRWIAVESRAAPHPAAPATAGPAAARTVSPTWRADGLEMAFAANKAGPYNLFLRPAGGPDIALDVSPWNQVPTSWSPDGRHLAFTEYHPATGADVWVLDRVTRERRPVARTPLDETGARYSPDGRWLAYLSRTTGQWQVTVVPAGGGPTVARFAPTHVRTDRPRAAVGGHDLRIVLAWFSELADRMRGPA